MGVGRQIYSKLTLIARKYTQEIKLALAFVLLLALFSISAGNRRERSKVVKAMNIYEYTEIFLNNHSFSTFGRSRLLPALIEEALHSKTKATVSFLSVFSSDRCKFAVNLATYAHAIKVPP